MLARPVSCLLSFALLIAIAAPAQAAPVKKDEIAYQNQNFKNWWATDLVWKFEDLPTQGVVPKFRVPYSGHDYPDRAGGTLDAMRKYDAAFSSREGSAADWEHEDVTNHGKGLFKGPVRPGSIWARARMRRSPHWYGHCNGWTAASIRHAEPQRSVRRNGVVFTPADIKGMLAEVYMYNDNEFCGGIDESVNPATLHVIISNWLGRGSHPLGMDSTLGEEVWNYPIYSFATKAKPAGKNKLDVWMTIAYATSTQQEFDESPRNRQEKYFHYTLDLNDKGEITGGTYLSDSDQIDMLWAPLNPVQGGKKGNELGNPYLDVKEVLAIWRESVPAEIRNKWLNIDPAEIDRKEMEAYQAKLQKEKPKDVAKAADGDKKDGDKTDGDKTDGDNEDETAKKDDTANKEGADASPRTAAAREDSETNER
jgi:hypothetical protein